MRVHVARSAGAVFEAHLRRDLDPGVDLSIGNAPDALPPADTVVLVSGRPTRAQLDACPALRHVVIPFAGVPAETRDVVRESARARHGLSLHVLHHNAAPTAELAIALVLAAAKAVVPVDAALRRGDWTMRYEDRDGPRSHAGLLLEGRTALVLGFGNVGRRVARALRGLGMEVLALRRRPDAPDGEAGDDVTVGGPDRLAEWLPRTHVVACCLPHTEATHGLLGQRELALLPDGAVLVNVGRGPIVDEDALFEELQAGRLAAGLDVWWRYPSPGEAESRTRTLPSARPFHELDTVVLSPHRAGDGDRTEALRGEHLAALLNAAARGEPVPNRVDLERGY